MKYPIIAALALAAFAGTSYRAEACNPLAGTFSRHEAPATLPADMLAKNHPTVGVQGTIVGLWHQVRTASDGTPFTEGFETWTLGGSEFELVNHPPVTGNVCVGVYTRHGRMYDITVHVAWLYDVNSNFVGTLSLTQTSKLAKDGNSYTGPFDAKFYDPSGNLFDEVTGTSVGERLVQ